MGDRGASEWRYFADDGVSAAFGLAADEGMAARADGPPTLRLYTYRSHCALLGRFQHLESELRREACEREGVVVNRRPTGGGAILMGQDQLGVAITLPRSAKARSGNIRALFTRYAEGLLLGLSRLGVDATFHRKNDLEVAGRKIAGMGIFFDTGGGMLFHTSLLVDLDVPLMLRVLRTPFEKISDKEIASVAQRITTVRRETGAPIAVPDVRDVVRDAYGEAFGARMVPDVFTASEREAIRELEARKYLTPDWIDQRGFPAETFGHSRVKTEGGLLHVHLTMTGDVIKAAYVTGDFFADEGVVSALERGLKRTPGAPDAIEDTVRRLYDDDGYVLPGVSPASVAAAVIAAVDAARGLSEKASPGGCFA